MAAPDLSGYVTVAERLAAALARFPDLRVVESAPEIVELGDAVYLSVNVTVYRMGDDPRPTNARAWERWPGRTPYTKDSEQMNASTSALGRALGYMGFGIARSISSADEVAVAQSRRELGERARPNGRAVRPAESGNDRAVRPAESADVIPEGLRRVIAVKAERLGVPVPELADRAAAAAWLDANAGFDTEGRPA